MLSFWREESSSGIVCNSCQACFFVLFLLFSHHELWDERYDNFVFTPIQKGTNCPSHPCTWSCIHCGTIRASCNGPSCCRMSITLHVFCYQRCCDTMLSSMVLGGVIFSLTSYALLSTVGLAPPCSFPFLLPNLRRLKKVQRWFFNNGKKEKETVASFVSADSTLRASQMEEAHREKERADKISALCVFTHGVILCMLYCCSYVFLNFALDMVTCTKGPIWFLFPS